MTENTEKQAEKQEEKKAEKPHRYFKVRLTFPEAHPGDILTLTVPAASEHAAVERVKADYAAKKIYPKFLTVKGV